MGLTSTLEEAHNAHGAFQLWFALFTITLE